MYLQFHSVKEPSRTKTFGFGFWSVIYRVRVRFLAKPGFWFGSFLLGSGSGPYLSYTARTLASSSRLAINRTHCRVTSSIKSCNAFALPAGRIKTPKVFFKPSIRYFLAIASTIYCRLDSMRFVGSLPRQAVRPATSASEVQPTKP